MNMIDVCFMHTIINKTTSKYILSNIAINDNEFVCFKNICWPTFRHNSSKMLAICQVDLMEKGYKTLTCSAKLIEELEDKILMREYLPTCNVPFQFADNPTFPCVLKHRHGFGSQQVHLIHDEAELSITKLNYSKGKYLVEEYVSGKGESCMQAVMKNGNILVHFEYTAYSKTDVYIWPHTCIEQTEFFQLPHDQIEMLENAFKHYSGFMTLNFKMRDAKMVIFDINTRLGSDLEVFGKERGEKLIDTFIKNSV